MKCCNYPPRQVYSYGNTNGNLHSYRTRSSFPYPWRPCKRKFIDLFSVMRFCLCFDRYLPPFTGHNSELLKGLLQPSKLNGSAAKGKLNNVLMHLRKFVQLTPKNYKEVLPLKQVSTASLFICGRYRAKRSVTSTSTRKVDRCECETALLESFASQIERAWTSRSSV